jgi:hypothetical protein
MRKFLITAATLALSLSAANAGAAGGSGSIPDQFRGVWCKQDDLTVHGPITVFETYARHGGRIPCAIPATVVTATSIISDGSQCVLRDGQKKPEGYVGGFRCNDRDVGTYFLQMTLDRDGKNLSISYRKNSE